MYHNHTNVLPSDQHQILLIHQTFTTHIAQGLIVLLWCELLFTCEQMSANEPIHPVYLFYGASFLAQVGLGFVPMR